MEITIYLESSLTDDAIELIEKLDEYQSSLYPAESNHLLPVEVLMGSNVRFFVARQEGEAIGCGDLYLDSAGCGEVKRMFVLPAARGFKLGHKILNCIEEQARREGLQFLYLETGIHQTAALALYRTAGFVTRGPFGDYKEDSLSVFMEKQL